ncbi:hypothetical protein BJY01DRAFT_91992 [Aspergillus pseudoustus]|uniref:Schlafen group 3-like DNA/RNA helicase domain-containing protein n=1 Tax=Aspergillus pseudoustus TaxID=1810923 RepID=A0ABR4KJQ2_9EURO
MISDTFLRDDAMKCLNSGAYLIIDEGQKTYSDTKFWGKIIQDQIIGNGYNVHICLFCSYRSSVTGVDRSPDLFTPDTLKPTQRISLTPHEHCDIGLCFNKNEFVDAIQKICQDHNTFHYGFGLNATATEYLFTLTNGHPGGLRSLLEYIFAKFRNSLKHHKPTDPAHNEHHMRTGEHFTNNRGEVTEEGVIGCLKDDRDVFRVLKSSQVYRSFAQGESLNNKEVLAVLLQVLNEGSIEVGGDLAEGKEMCYVNAWLHKSAIQNDRKGKEVYVYPSRLHEKWVEYMLGDVDGQLDDKYDNIQTLSLEILSKFSRRNLKNTAEGRLLSTAENTRPLDAAYQDEFYRCFREVTGGTVEIVSEWSRTKDGRVDFVIPEKKWAVELLRDGDRLGDHIARFYPEGRYHDWIKDGSILEWAVINCTDRLPQMPSSEKNLLHAMFSEDWRRMGVYDHDLTLIKVFNLKN